jgi:hypothetical protein
MKMLYNARRAESDGRDQEEEGIEVLAIASKEPGRMRWLVSAGRLKSAPKADHDGQRRGSPSLSRPSSTGQTKLTIAGCRLPQPLATLRCG